MSGGMNRGTATTSGGLAGRALIGLGIRATAIFVVVSRLALIFVVGRPAIGDADLFSGSIRELFFLLAFACIFGLGFGGRLGRLVTDALGLRFDHDAPLALRTFDVHARIVWIAASVDTDATFRASDRPARIGLARSIDTPLARSAGHALAEARLRWVVLATSVDTNLVR